jgi:hypothetical protein
MPYTIGQLTQLLGLTSKTETRSIIHSDGMQDIFEEYRSGIGGHAAPARPGFKLRNVTRLMRLSDRPATGPVWSWTAEDPDKTGWGPDFHAARFAWQADRWVEGINGGWVRSVDRDREVARLLGLLWYMHERYIDVPMNWEQLLMSWVWSR